MTDIKVPARADSHGRRKSGHAPTTKRKNGPVSYLVVNAEVWKTALALAERRTERIEVISPTNVHVWTVGGKAGR